MAEAPPKRKKINYGNARQEAKKLVIKHRGTLAIGLAIMFVSRFLGLIMPAMPKVLGDRVLTPHRPDLLLPIAIIAAVAMLAKAALDFTLSQIVSVAAQRAIADMREEMQHHVLRLPVSYFDSTKSGVLISRIMNDPEGVRNLIGTGLIQFVGGLVTALFAFIILMKMNWQLTLGTIAFMLAFAGGVSYAMAQLRPIFRKRGEITADVTGRLGETLGGVRLVKTYVAEEREEKVFDEGVTRLFKNIASTITGTSALGAMGGVVGAGIAFMILLIGGRAVLNGGMKVTDLFSYVMFLVTMVLPLVQIANIGTQITEAFAGLDRIREIRSMRTEDDEDAQRAPVATVDGAITFDDVSFEYEAGVPVLHDVSFHADAGTTTALVGPSGSGKSTLIGLVMAFNHPQEGLILVDGKDLQSLRLRDYRRQLGVVMQDNFLFDGTIRDNIAYSKPNATDEEIRAAGRIAHCEEFVSRWELGYDTVVGERGVKLSGGQRQRVAIARAIVADPRILVLDEATSSLDSESEAMIQDGLRSLRKGRTTFVIAHRLSTIISADQILVLDAGRIVERGTHTQLLANGGLYRRLYERQQGLMRDLYINPGEDPIPEQAEDIKEAANRIAARIASQS